MCPNTCILSLRSIHFKGEGENSQGRYSSPKRREIRGEVYENKQQDSYLDFFLLDIFSNSEVIKAALNETAVKISTNCAFQSQPVNISSRNLI